MRLAPFLLPLAAAAALAQTSIQAPQPKFPVPNASTKVVPVILAPNKGCPVGLFAEKSGTGQTLWTISLEDSHSAQHILLPPPVHEPGQGVHVQLSSAGPSALRQVELSVDYVPAGGRILPVEVRGGEAGPPSTASKTFELSAGNGPALLLAGDLFVGQVAGITRVHVLRIHYDNGTTWQPGHGASCSVEPSGFMLAGAR